MSDGSIIIDTNLNNEELKTQIGKLNGLIDKGMKGAMVSIGAIVGAITGIGVSAAKVGTEYQTASNQLQASTGATANEMNNLKDVMKNVYANNFGEDMNDVANSLATVRKELRDLDSSSLQSATENAITLRDTFDYDVSESVRSAKALMNNFGISSDEAFNLIAQGAQNGLDYSGELLDNISEYSVQFSKVGLDAEDMFDIFKAGAENGAFNLDKIGDAVKEFSIRAIDGSKTTSEGFTKLGLNVDTMAQKFAKGGDTAKQAFYEVIQRIANMDDKVQQSIVGVDLFGTMWEDLGPGVITQLGSMQGQFDKTKNSAEQLKQIKYDDLGSAIQGIGRQIQTNLLLPIGEKLLPVFNNLANKMQEAFSSEEVKASIEKISNVIGTLIEGIASFAEKWLPKIIDLISWVISNAPTILSILAGITAGLKVIQIGSKIADVIEKIKNLKNIITGVGGAFKVLSSIFAVNPFVLIIGAIVGLVTALVVLWNTNEDFRNFIIGVWNAIKTTVGNIINGIVSFFTETIPNAINNFVAFWQGFAEGFKTVFINAWNGIVSFFTETIPAWIQNIITWFQQLPYNIGVLIGEILGKIVSFGINMWNWVTTELPKIIQGVIDWFKELPGKIWEWLCNVVTKIAEWGQNIWSTATTCVSNTINGIIDWFKKLPGRIWEWLTNTINNIINWGRDLVNKGKQAAQDLYNNIVNTIKELPEKVKNIGKNIVEGLWNGITGMGNWLKDKIFGFAGGIIDGFKSTFKIHSPSLVMNKEIGRFLALGLGEGFIDNIDKVYRKMRMAVNFETQKLSTNLSTTASVNRIFTANITLQGSDVYMDSTKVGRVVTPTVSRNLKLGGVY